MNDKYLLSSKNHEDWRNHLIVNSFFFDTLLKDLRVKLNLPEEGFRDLPKMFEWERKKLSKIRKRITPKTRGKKSGVRIVKEMLSIEDAVRREAYVPIWKAVEKFNDLNLSYPLVHSFVLGHKQTSFSGSSRVLMVSSPNDPIKETGIYIKYSPELSIKEMAQLMKEANESFRTLFNITHKSKLTKDKSGKSYVKKATLKIRQRRTSVPRKNQLKIYMEIQDCLRKNYIDHSDSIKMGTVFKKVGDKLQVNEGSIKRSYHALMSNFQLPTSIHTRKISD